MKIAKYECKECHNTLWVRAKIINNSKFKEEIYDYVRWCPFCGTKYGPSRYEDIELCEKEIVKDEGGFR